MHSFKQGSAGVQVAGTLRVPRPREEIDVALQFTGLAETIMRRPTLTVPQILAWADAFHKRSGQWPNRDSGRITGSLGETWTAVNLALRNCGRGLHVPGTSLAQLLEEKRGVRNRMRLPKFTIRKILDWTIAHRERTGTWPTNLSGPVLDAPGESWRAVDTALRKGARGLKGGSSLFQLLREHHRVRLHRRIQAITTDQILEWADAWFARRHKPPTRISGPIPGTRGITWGAAGQMLVDGYRGLPGGSSLSRLLEGRFPVRSRHLPPLRISQILTWAKAYFREHGRWPTVKSPGLAGTSQVTWGAVHQALLCGYRGLPGGSSLSKLLRQHFKRNRSQLATRRRRVTE
jgi:hypothetical protein